MNRRGFLARAVAVLAAPVAALGLTPKPHYESAVARAWGAEGEAFARTYRPKAVMKTWELHFKTLNGTTVVLPCTCTIEPVCLEYEGALFVDDR